MLNCAYDIHRRRRTVLTAQVSRFDCFIWKVMIHTFSKRQKIITVDKRLGGRLETELSGALA